MPHPTVLAIRPLANGYLLVGTAAGLACFDGIRFTPLEVGEGTTGGRPEITALHEDHRGAVWVGTRSEGLFRWSEGKWRQFDRAAGLLDRTVTSLAETEEGGVWIGTSAGLNRFQDEKLEAFTDREGLPDEAIVSLHAGRRGNLWITTRTGVCQFSRGRFEPFEAVQVSQGRSTEFLGVYEDRNGVLWAYGDTFLLNLTEGRRFNYFASNDPSAARVWTIFEDRAGSLWIGTRGRGLVRFHAGRFLPVTSGEEERSLDVRAIAEDADGTLWIGTTGGGLTRLTRRRLAVIGEADGLPSRPVRAIATDGTGQVWVGIEGEGLWAAMDGRFEPWRPGGGMDEVRHVTALTRTLDGSLWIATWGQGLRRWQSSTLTALGYRQGLADLVVQALAPAGSNGVWLGTQSGLIQRTDGLTVQSVGRCDTSGTITCLAPGRDGTLWVGTSAGVFRGRNGVFEPVDDPRLSGARVTGLEEDAGGRVWVATADRGLWLEQSGTWRVVDRQRALPVTGVLQLALDAAGGLWLGTDRGLANLSRANRAALASDAGPARAALFSADEGLGDVRFSPGVIPALDRAGRIWMGTRKGLLRFSPADFVATNPPPAVRIEAVLVNGRRGDPGEARVGPPTAGADLLRLPARHNSVEIEYSAPTLSTAEHIQFRHRLEGFDADWVEVGRERRARYPRLPPGPYRFRVVASDRDGAWGTVAAELNLEVPTPWWSTWWFLGGAGLGGVALMAGTVRVIELRRLRRRLERAEREHAIERERARIARDMHDEIGAKLTRISFLSELAKDSAAQPATAAARIDSIAETSRTLLRTLDEMVWAVNPRNDTLEHLLNYVGQQAREYFQGTAIECEVQVPDPIPPCSLAAETRHHVFLAVEEALNNALKHSGGSRVRMGLELRRGGLEIEVTDNGRGMPPTEGVTASGARNGLGNMRQRLEALGGTCAVSGPPGVGTTVTFWLPLPVGECHS